MISTVLFDLDGTLLPMDQDQFTKTYFKLLVKKMAPMGGYDPHELAKNIWACVDVMTANKGTETNEQVFWDSYAKIYGEDSLKLKPDFMYFYSHELNDAKPTCGFNPNARAIVKKVKDAGYRVALASNPMLPYDGMITRLKWAGVDEDDFEFITSYEDYTRCKPDVGYFTEICEKNDIDPATCIMVGDSLKEDIIPASKAGMKTFMITENLPDEDSGTISTANANSDVSADSGVSCPDIKSGSFDAFWNYLVSQK